MGRFLDSASPHSGSHALRVLHVLVNLVEVEVLVDRCAIGIHHTHGLATPTSTQALTGSLAAGGTLVLVNTLATADFKVAGSVVSGVTNFNGDDALVLEKSGQVIDRIGQLGTDPGTEWKVGTATTLNATLRRNAAIKKGDSNAAGPFDPSLEWTVFPIDDATGLGKHTVNP